MSEKPVLIVEDEAEIAGLLRDYLRAEGFSVSWLARGDAVPDWLSRHPAALILLDLALPGLSGMEICKQVRQSSNLPIIMLSARVEEIDRLLGLELGADDYVCKPFSPRELVARVKAVLRRFQAPPADATPISPDAATPTSPTDDHLSGAKPASATTHGLTTLHLDESTLRVHWQGRTVELTAVEFSLLATLHASPGRIYSRNRLMALIYRDHRVVSDRTIDSHIKKLRRKLEDLSPDQEWVHSVYGVGYRYEEQD